MQIEIFFFFQGRFSLVLKVRVFFNSEMAYWNCLICTILENKEVVLGESENG